LWPWPKITIYRPVVEICRPVSPNFTHWATLKFCPVLQNFSKFQIKPKSHCTKSRIPSNWGRQFSIRCL